MHYNVPHQAGMPSEIRQRRWYRYPVDLSLRVQVSAESGPVFMLAHGRDVSQGGMAVYVPVELEIGQTVLLEFSFPGLSQPLILPANIKNRMGFKYGVEFMNPTVEQQEIILVNIHRLLATAARKALAAGANSATCRSL